MVVDWGRRYHCRLGAGLQGNAAATLPLALRWGDMAAGRSDLYGVARCM